ncbi:hypothetical protein BDB00DRAFT_876544 [Zychaea mexicana]|uniref:uncharacterized protein n=1 Tax=Zychaea mexicana TaxID=64656 RepID=UPI0022FDCC80|nr:uncharacterized protein BDB00DRAFT_876544 [Zychaea mexicana]KAI9489268.1 hypothetical protein BDB00DRAFT_876544 [Zychaea mexicana]
MIAETVISSHFTTGTDEELAIDGFTLVTRQDSSTVESLSQRAFGTAIYIRSSMVLGPLMVSSIYASPQAPIDTLIAALDEILVNHQNTAHILAGDFNINLNSPEDARTSRLLQFLATHRLLPALAPEISTTRSGISIDTYFTNFPATTFTANTYTTTFYTDYEITFSVSLTVCLSCF